MSPVKPSTSEEEYFVREEAEKKRKLALEKAKEIAAKEWEELKKLHHMHCPKCGMKLEEIAFRGILVDKCFTCHGVWFDDGEVEKLLGEDGTWHKLLRLISRSELEKETDG